MGWIDCIGLWDVGRICRSGGHMGYLYQLNHQVRIVSVFCQTNCRVRLCVRLIVSGSMCAGQALPLLE